MTVTKKAKNAHKAKIENCGDKPLDYDNNYSREFATICSNCDASPRVPIKSVKNLNKIRNTLRRQYQASNLDTKDNAVS